MAGPPCPPSGRGTSPAEARTSPKRPLGPMAASRRPPTAPPRPRPCSLTPTARPLAHVPTTPVTPTVVRRAGSHSSGAPLCVPLPTRTLSDRCARTHHQPARLRAHTQGLRRRCTTPPRTHPRRRLEGPDRNPPAPTPPPFIASGTGHRDKEAERANAVSSTFAKPHSPDTPRSAGPASMPAPTHKPFPAESDPAVDRATPARKSAFSRQPRRTGAAIRRRTRAGLRPARATIANLEACAKDQAGGQTRRGKPRS